MKKWNGSQFYQHFLCIMLILLILPLTVGFTQVIFIDFIDYARFSFSGTWMKWILVILLLITLIVLIKILRRIFWSKRRFWIVFLLMNLVILIMRVCWLRLFPINSYYDMNEVLQAAFAITNGDYQTFSHNGYLFMAPTNIPITFILTWVIGVMKQLAIPAEWTSLARCMQLINLVMMQGITLILSGCVYWLSDRDHAKTILALIVIALFFPYLSYTFYVYNDIPSVVFYSMMLLFFILYEKQKKAVWIILTAVCLTIGNLIRPIGTIYLLAFLFYFLTVRFSKKHLLLCFVFLLLFQIPTRWMDQALMKEGYTTFSITTTQDIELSRQLNGICKGFSYGTDGQTPGFFSLPCDQIWQRNHGDYTEASRQYRQMIQEEWQQFENPWEWLQFLVTKYLYQWGDGSFETVTFNDIGPQANQITSFMPQYSSKRQWVQRTMIGDWIIQYNQAFWMIMLLTFLHSTRKNQEEILSFFYLCILGFMAFYLIWEVSPHYLFPLIPIMLVLFIHELESFFQRLQKGLICFLGWIRRKMGHHPDV